MTTTATALPAPYSLPAIDPAHLPEELADIRLTASHLSGLRTTIERGKTLREQGYTFTPYPHKPTVVRVDLPPGRVAKLKPGEDDHYDVDIEARDCTCRARYGYGQCKHIVAVNIYVKQVREEAEKTQLWFKAAGIDPAPPSTPITPQDERRPVAYRETRITRGVHGQPDRLANHPDYPYAEATNRPARPVTAAMDAADWAR